MRILIIPELYRPADASANATLNDAVTWVEQWLAIDESIHVYWLLPPREAADYEADYVLADRERVTLVEAETFMSGREYSYLFTETGYTEGQLDALKTAIYDELGYVDVVVDQLRQGRATLYKWLLFLTDHRPGEPTPFSLVANVHDLMLPFKYPSDGYRIDYHRRLEVVEAVFADGRWFKARLDADEMPVFGGEFLQPSLLTRAVDGAVMTDSPIDFSKFDEQYADEPRWLHVAGSNWGKKNGTLVMDIAEMLYERYGIETILTSMDTIPERYATLPWVDAYPEAPRDLYERMLRKGDLAICATEYDTLARTWFEQAASGQVLVLRDEPWIYECVPEDCGLVAPVDRLAERAAWVAEHWAEAVAENRRLIAHVAAVRNPQRTGRRTYDDMAARVAARLERDGVVRRERTADAVADVLGRSDADSHVDLDVGRVRLDELSEAASTVTDDGAPLLEQEWCSITHLVYALRSLGYEDVGNAGTPVFALRTDSAE